MLTVKTHTFRAGAVLPVFKTAGAAGADIRAFLKDIEKDHPIWNYIQIDAEGPFILIPGNDRVLIPTGLAFEVPTGHEMQIRTRSGLAWNDGLFVLNSPGTIDSDYRGEVAVIMLNTGKEHKRIRHGDRIAQCLIAPTVVTRYKKNLGLSETERGNGAYGSTGRE